MKIGDLIKEYRQLNTLTMQDFADKSGLSKSYISMLEKGKHPQNNREIVPSIETVKNIAVAMGISVDDILDVVDNNQLIDISHRRITGSLPHNVITSSSRIVPILGTICAGDGVLCEENYEGKITIDNKVLGDYALYVKGDSMTDAGIYDGDLVFIKKDFCFEEGKIYAVVFGVEESASLKRVYLSDGDFLLSPCNQGHKPILSSKDDTFIIGEYVGVYRSINQ